VLEPDERKRSRPVLRGERERKLSDLLGGWKAIPNALKGRVIPDDDQFTLGVCLLSTLDDNPTCHIYLVPQTELSDFFAMRQGDYPLFP